MVGEGRASSRKMPLAEVPARRGRRCVRKHLRVDARPSLVALGVTGAMLLVLGCSGCGGGGPKRPPPPKPHAPKPWKPGKRAAAGTNVCTGQGRAAFAAGVGVAARAVKERRTQARSGAAECVFSAGRVVASVSVSGAPDAYAVMERGAIEQAQIFGGKRFEPAPQLILGEGVAAYWFPAEHLVMTTEGVNLITATIVRWPHTPVRRHRALAAALARPYLGKVSKKFLRGPAP